MKKAVILAAVAALALLAVGYVVLLPMIKGKSAEAVEEDEPVASAKKPRRPTAPGLIYPVPERVVNLAGPPGVPHYARIELALEFAPPKGSKKAGAENAGGHGGSGKEPALDPALAPVVARKAQIDDMLLRVISARSVEQMTSADGKEALKQEILAALEEIVPEPTPVAVYIVRLVVQ